MYQRWTNEYHVHCARSPLPLARADDTLTYTPLLTHPANRAVAPSSPRLPPPPLSFNRHQQSPPAHQPQERATHPPTKPSPLYIVKARRPRSQTLYLRHDMILYVSALNTCENVRLCKALGIERVRCGSLECGWCLIWSGGWRWRWRWNAGVDVVVVV